MTKYMQVYKKIHYAPDMICLHLFFLFTQISAPIGDSTFVNLTFI